MSGLGGKLLYFSYFRLMPGQFSVHARLRRLVLKRLLKQDLERLVVQANVHISRYRHLKLGNDVSINHNCFLFCEGGLEIGDYVAIGHSTTILTTEHGYDDPSVPIKYQPIRQAPVKIGRNTWIGAKVTILAGVTIAEGTVIAAGAVVTRSITEPNTIVGGVPARFIKHRFAQPATEAE
jgi:acetyltransferase-like isoleucine patch superfamily enzyme